LFAIFNIADMFLDSKNKNHFYISEFYLFKQITTPIKI